MEIHVSPVEALAIREAKEAKRLKVDADENTPLVSLDQKSLFIPDFSSSSFSRSLAEYSGSDDGPIPDDLRLVIASMVRILKEKRLEFMIEGIANDLQRAQRSWLAHAVRQEASRSK